MSDTREILVTECKKHGQQPVFVSVFHKEKVIVKGCYKCILEYQASEESRGSTEQA